MGAIRIKRRSSSGSTGSPSTLLNAELAYNEADNTLYYGYGDNGSGGATSVVSIAGQGAYATLNTAQTITGNKVFSGNLTYTGSVDSNANNTQVATTSWVQNRIASSAYSLPAATTSTLGGIIVGDNLSVDANGVLSGVNSYTLPAATNSTLGGVIIPDGGGLAIDAGGNLTGSYVPLANITGTGWAGKTFIGGVYGNPTANLIAGANNDRGVNQFLVGYGNGTERAVFWADSSYARLLATTDGTNPNIASVEVHKSGDIQLRLAEGHDATLNTTTANNNRTWSNDSILTRSYADTRYAPIGGGNYVENQSQYGNLTVTDSVAFSGGLQCELSAPSFGEKIIHYALNGGARTDWLANTTVEGSYYGASIAGSAGGAGFQKTTFSSYPYNASYTQILLTDTDATLTLGKIGTDTVKSKVWTTNSILTKSYADSQYLPLLANVTSNSTIPIRTYSGSSSTVTGEQFVGNFSTIYTTSVVGYSPNGAFYAECYAGNDPSNITAYTNLNLTSSTINLFYRNTTSPTFHGFESSGAGNVGTRLTNRTSTNATGMINLNAGTTAFPAMSDSGKGFTALMHAGNGAELTADSMNLGICANSTHGTAELRFGANLTAVRNANSILTQGYADTRYLQNASLTGTIFESFTPNGNGFILAEANATNGMLIGNIEFPGYSKYRGTMVSENDAFKTVGLIDGTPQIGWASATGTMALEVSNSDVRIEDTTGSKTWASQSILTRGYADTRYLQSTGTGSIGDLTVTGNLTVQGTTVTLNTDTLVVEDKNIVIANVTSPTDVTADGGGLTLLGATNKTFNWYDATDAWTSSEHFDLISGKEYRINNASVLTATSLGSSVVSSSLTSVGTISSGTWQGTAIGVAYGGTGATTITGIVKGNGSNPMTAATAGTDYLAPNSTIDGGTF